MSTGNLNGMANLTVIIAFAADRLPEEAEQATKEDRVEDLSRLNQRVHSGDELFKLWAEAKGGKAIAIGAGDGRIEVGADHLEELNQLKDQYNQAVGSTCSVGVGTKLSEAEKALTYAQRTGGNSIELYTKELEQELADLQEPEGEEKLFNSFFDKAEPALNTGPGRPGIKGPMQPGQPGMDKPVEEGSEHSENEALQSEIENNPAPQQPDDVLGHFTQLAAQSQQKEGEANQAQAQEHQDGEEQQSLRGAVVEVLKQFKEQAPLWEQLKEAQPDAYKTLTGVMQAMVALARKALVGDKEDGEDGEDENPSPSLTKAEEELLFKGEFRSAAFRHKDGTVVETGAYHNIEPWLLGGSMNHRDDGPHNSSDWEAGFVTHGNIFMNRDEAAKHVNLQRYNPVTGNLRNLDSQDPEAGLRKIEPSLTASPVSAAPPVASPTPPTLHDKVEPFLSNLKSLPKEGAARGKFITQHMNHGPFLQALQKHPQGRQVYGMLTNFMNSKANAGPNVSSKVMAKTVKTMRKAALEAGKTGRHLVNLPVGSQIDPSASGTRKAGKIKVQTPTGSKWRSVRANMVASSKDGSPTSSRRPNQ